MTELIELLKLMKERAASDLHITTGTKPRFRINGRLAPLEDYRDLSPEDTRELCTSFMNDSQRAKFESTNEIDASFGIQGLSRFRADIFLQRGAVAGTFREIPFNIKPLADLGLPAQLQEVLARTRGLILVTGPAGSGKSTTIASMIETINAEREAHIVTIEDPIEFLHSHNKCIINQREVSSDTASFRAALGFVMRQDPDVVMISAINDLASMESALAISETGHLAIAAMHTSSAIQTLTRIVDMFPHDQHEYARDILADCIECIISQRLVKLKGNNGRTLAREVLIPTPSVRTLIKEGRFSQIYPIMQTARSGMKTMNQSLVDLCTAGTISAEEALACSQAPDEIMSKLKKPI